MHLRWRIILLLLPLTIVSFWAVYQLEQDTTDTAGTAEAVPDYTMSGLDSLNMTAAGKPETRLTADFMAHFESKDETRLTGPLLEIFRPDREPLYVRADQGWVTSGNEVILLKGDVRFWENNARNELIMEVTTSEARVFPERDYAETDKPATLSTANTQTDSVGMKAYMDEGRIEMLSQVHTTIEEGTLLKSAQ